MYYMMVCSMLSWEIKTCNFSCIKPVWRGRFSVRIAWESPLRFRPTVHTSLALHYSCFWRKNTIYQKRNTSCYPWSLHLICKGQRIEWKSITIQIFKSEPNIVIYHNKIIFVGSNDQHQLSNFGEIFACNLGHEEHKTSRTGSTKVSATHYQWKGVV